MKSQNISLSLKKNLEKLEKKYRQLWSDTCAIKDVDQERYDSQRKELMKLEDAIHDRALGKDI